LALRAVIFDYGMVLTGPQEPEALAALLRITGLGQERFHSLYWADRHAYDEGKLTGVEFWEKFISEAGLELGPDAVAELKDWDARLWTPENVEMLRWQECLMTAGLKTAILSNMGDAVLARIEREVGWIKRFDLQVWSSQLLVAKPDSRIYTHTLNLLGVEPAEVLFLDDRLVNIVAARALGMQGFVFSTVEQLRVDLVATGLDRELPLPA
jgi:putative hydrolase of the HAD superfamily